MTAARDKALAALSERAAQGRPLRLWLRDDDASQPTPALDRLLDRAAAHQVPLTLAVIPQPWDGPPTGAALAERLAGQAGVSVGLHGWSHRNHAPAGVKKQELGLHRPAAAIHAELRAGLALLRALHGTRLLPMLIPPWNRIDPDLAAALSHDGLTALSTFGPERPVPGLAVVNTQIDIIDWKAGRIGRPAGALWGELAGWAQSGRDFVGVLTHHLVHDAAAWTFLDDLFQSAAAAGALWSGAADLAASAGPGGG